MIPLFISDSIKFLRSVLVSRPSLFNFFDTRCDCGLVLFIWWQKFWFYHHWLDCNGLKILFFEIFAVYLLFYAICPCYPLSSHISHCPWTFRWLFNTDRYDSSYKSILPLPRTYNPDFVLSTAYLSVLLIHFLLLITRNIHARPSWINLRS